MEKELVQQLNAPEKAQRIAALKELRSRVDRGLIQLPEREGYTNNHVHTKYSFSPYSPAMAVWKAVGSGLSTVGIIDHDAINGAEEFIEAGEILGIPTTIGFEIRTDWSATGLNGRRINNPDQISNAYICAHGIPHTQIAKADTYLKKIRDAREKRNRAMMERLNTMMQPYGIVTDYDADVLPISYAKFGGEVTERHLLYALTEKMMQKYGKGQPIIDFIIQSLGMALSDSQRKLLADENNAIYAYDVLNILKGSFVSRIFIDATGAETPDIREAVAFIKECGAIPSYCYLGDVAASPTGDKKAQKFEDEYLEDVLDTCRDIGFDAIAYMPSRNTVQQLDRVMTLCDQYGFMQISGEDINQPRQSFICKQLKDERYSHLIDTTWALVGHEIAATQNLENGMFASGNKPDMSGMKERIEKYKKIGLEGIR
jgi:hypothetical protein